MKVVTTPPPLISAEERDRILRLVSTIDTSTWVLRRDMAADGAWRYFVSIDGEHAADWHSASGAVIGAIRCAAVARRAELPQPRAHALIEVAELRAPSPPRPEPVKTKYP